MQGGKRKLTPWNLLVQKVFRDGKKTNKNYSFKQALSDASRRKGEMGQSMPNEMTHSRKHRTK
jgi:hypothetical protein